MGSITHNSDDGMLEIGGENGSLGQGRGGEKRIKFGMSGCHDTTLAAMLCSLGAFEGEKWPPYTSHIAVELFRKNGEQEYNKPEPETQLKPRMLSFGSTKRTKETEGGIPRRMTSELSQAEREKMDGYFVRIRYNDRPITVPGCKLPGKHLEGDESFCTLVSRDSEFSRFSSLINALRRLLRLYVISLRPGTGKRLVLRIWTSRVFRRRRSMQAIDPVDV